MNEWIIRIPFETDRVSDVISDVDGWELSEMGGVVIDEDADDDGDGAEGGGFCSEK